MGWMEMVVPGVGVSLIVAIIAFFAKSIWNFLIDRLLALWKPEHLADVSGQWESTFTWQSGRARQATDKIEVKQTGRSVSGKTLTGDYRYRFKGRFVDNTLLVGEWKSQENRPLFGPFLLRVHASNRDRVSGYWIGNGDSLFHGKWTWKKI